MEPLPQTSKRQPPPRVVIEGVAPQIDAGRFAAKRTVGEALTVTADIFTEGHDALAADLLWRREADADADWTAVPMDALVNDRWSAAFTPTDMGRYLYSVTAWVDRFETWRRDTAKKHAAGVDVSVESLSGVELVKRAGKMASGIDEAVLDAAATELDAGAIDAVLDNEPLRDAMRRWGDRAGSVTYERELALEVDRERARFSSWYEFFPRSCGEPGRHGTFADCQRQLDYAAELGFDVVYLPPIHPIGVTNRKGRNNSLTTEPGDPGSPWAIGAAEGGHDAIHPELGTSDDLRALVAAATERGMEIALDLAFQCSPDHPWVTEHPEWFRHRADGSIQYAENPPKKYQDIYPIDFESEDWKNLWPALRGVVDHWIDHGVRIFRVDNPHTKPFRFWEWLIAGVKREHPDVLFLAEAFTRPKVMNQLAKLGFSQSYTYFAWRQTKWELTEYLTELTRTEQADFFRPNFWPNTPDILTEQLQFGTRSVFLTRLVLASTLAASYGIYGPAYELTEHVARPGSEEYIDNEKYELKVWDLDRSDSLRHVIARLNQIRRAHPALQHDRTLRFHATDNEQLLCWSKSERDPAGGDPGDVMLMVVNLDPHHVQAGWVDLDLAALGVDEDGSFQAHDELGGAHFLWRGRHNYVQLDPASMPAHAMAIRTRVRTEQDFDYFM